MTASRCLAKAHIVARIVSGGNAFDLAQYRELEAFAQFASDLDQATQNQLARGERTVEVLKQGILKTWPVEEQVVIIFAVTSGLMDDIPVEEIKTFEEDLMANLRGVCADALAEIKSEKVLTDEIKETIKSRTADFKTAWNQRGEDA